MVEVLKSNFLELLPVIEETIKNASFITIDTEFTGLNTSLENKSSFFDSMQECYIKLKEAASSFTICQLGLTAFTRAKWENSYSAETYIFYLRPHLFGSMDGCFLFQASCIDFLASYGMDFNKFFHEGIPYLNEFQEMKAKQEMEEGTLIFNHMENSEHLTKAQHHDISCWLSKAEDGDEMNISLENASYFHISTLRLKYENLWARFGESNQIVLQKVSLKKKEQYLRNISKEEEEEMLLQYYLGFSHVFKALVKYKKVLVGHNLFRDLLLFYHNFYNPLPDKLTEFRRKFTKLFPVVYDTKHIWMNFKKHCDVGRITMDSGLYELYELLKSTPDNLSVLFSPSIEYKNCAKYVLGFLATDFIAHDAGFDSFITGWVFLRLCHIVAIKKVVCLERIIPQSWGQHLRAVKPFENKINVSRAKLHFLDLASDNPISHRPEYLFVSLKDKKFKLDLIKLEDKLKKYGFVEVQKTSSCEALVAVATFGCATDILSNLQDDPEYYIETFKYWQHSWLSRSAVWTCCITSICMSFFLALRLYKINRLW